MNGNFLFGSVKETTTIRKRLILIKLENNDFYCFANCPIFHQLFFVLVTSKLTSVYSWLSAVVTLNMQAPPSTPSCAVLALRLFRSLPPMPITSQSSKKERAQLSQLSGGRDFPTANSDCRIPRRATSIDQVTSQLTYGIAKLVLGSFDRNIFQHQNRQLNEHKYFF